MSYIDELSKLIKSVASAQGSLEDLRKKSITRGALDGTMQFPCLISNAIEIDMAATIARTLERVYASFAQSYLSMNNTIDISVDKNPSQFLKKFHRNIKLESTNVDIYYENCVEEDVEYEQLMERVYDGTTKAFMDPAGKTVITFGFSDAFSKPMVDMHQRLLTESMKNFDFRPFPNVGNSPFFEADFAEDPLGYIAQKEVDAQYNTATTKANELNKALYNRPNVPTLSDKDVKKSNDLAPYAMQVRLMAVNGDGDFVQFMDFIVGIKVNLHVIKSEEMIANIQRALQNNGKFFNFLRWTTGEVSLFKDLLFHINDAKTDASNRSMGHSPWWSTLKKIREESNAQRAYFSRTRILPDATFVLSSYDVDAIKNGCGYNLRDAKVVNKLKDTLFFMNFIIVDDATGTLDILYDGENTYQTYALETLEREVSMNSNKLGKEIGRMISR